MAGRSDIRFTWFGRLPPRSPMFDPCLAVDELEDAHPLQVWDGALAGEELGNSGRIDDPRGGEPSAEQPVADLSTKMIEQPGREAARRALDPTVEHGRW